MSEWRTRTGHEVEDVSPQSGEDLAQVRSKMEANRREGRHSQQALREQERHQRVQQLEQQAGKARHRRALLAFLTRPALWACILIGLLALIGWQTLPEPVEKAVDPPLSAKRLQRGLVQLDTQAAREMQVVKPRRLSILTRPEHFEITYRAEAGQLRLDGTRLTKPCALILAVPRLLPYKEQGRLRGRVLRRGGC